MTIMKIAVLIDLYKQHPCLYVVNHPNYYKKNNRYAALQNCINFPKLVIL